MYQPAENNTALSFLVAFEQLNENMLQWLKILRKFNCSKYMNCFKGTVLIHKSSEKNGSFKLTL